MAVYRIEHRDAGLRQWRVAKKRRNIFDTPTSYFWEPVGRFWSREAAERWIAKQTWRAAAER